MNHRMAVQSVSQVMLNQIYHIVHSQNITLSRNFCVQGNQYSAGTVIVDDQIMNTNDTLISHNNIIDLLHKFRIRCLTKQRTDRIFGSVDTGKTDEQTNYDAAVTIYLNSGKVCYQGGNQDYSSGSSIAHTVCGSSHHSCGIQLLADFPVIISHITLDCDGSNQNTKNHRGKTQFFRMQYFVHRRLYQFKSHQQDDKGYHQAGYVFNASVTERMVRVRLLPCHFKTHQGDDRRTGIGQIVNRVRCDGDGIAQHPRQEFPGK